MSFFGKPDKMNFQEAWDVSFKLLGEHYHVFFTYHKPEPADILEAVAQEGIELAEEVKQRINREEYEVNSVNIYHPWRAPRCDLCSNTLEVRQRGSYYGWGPTYNLCVACVVIWKNDDYTCNHSGMDTTFCKTGPCFNWRQRG